MPAYLEKSFTLATWDSLTKLHGTFQSRDFADLLYNYAWIAEISFHCWAIQIQWSSSNIYFISLQGRCLHQSFTGINQSSHHLSPIYMSWLDQVKSIWQLWYKYGLKHRSFKRKSHKQVFLIIRFRDRSIKLSH